MTLIEKLCTLPEGTAAITDFIHQFDECFLNGFVGTQYDILPTVKRIFTGTPLEGRIAASIEALAENEFTEVHFGALAAARCALQGTLYDVLYRHMRFTLGRSINETAPTPPAQPHPLLDSTRHWLMELALTGFARLERDMVQTFAPTLVQMRAQPEFFNLSALLAGFINELMANIPVAEPEHVPLTRWCDLWSTAMLQAVGAVDYPSPTTISGMLTPLGVEQRLHDHTVSIIAYGVIMDGKDARLIRQTWSSFKVSAINSEESWLLFPQAEAFLQALAQGKNLILNDMPVLPSGDLLWDEAKVKVGKKAKLQEIALQHCGIGADLCLSPLPALQRHPVQIAEPLAFKDYVVADETLRLSDGSVLPFRSNLPSDALAHDGTLFGLLRYERGQWIFDALTAGEHFIGQNGAELLKKPPKSSTVSILKERSSRLLRG